MNQNTKIEMFMQREYNYKVAVLMLLISSQYICGLSSINKIKSVRVKWKRKQLENFILTYFLKLTLYGFMFYIKLVKIKLEFLPNILYHKNLICNLNNYQLRVFVMIRKKGCGDHSSDCRWKIFFISLLL